MTSLIIHLQRARLCRSRSPSSTAAAVVCRRAVCSQRAPAEVGPGGSQVPDGGTDEDCNVYRGIERHDNEHQSVAERHAEDVQKRLQQQQVDDGTR